jgi:hypothetical protein
MYGEDAARLRGAAHFLRSVVYENHTSMVIRDTVRDLKILKESAERLRTLIVNLCSSDDLIELSGRAQLGHQ